jgi:hypothetical protein
MVAMSMKQEGLCYKNGLDKTTMVCEALFAAVARLVFPRKYASVKELLEDFPELGDSRETEAQKLLEIANMMECLMRCKPARMNKGWYIRLTTKIVEGKHVEHITGSGQTRETGHRVLLFERLGGCVPVPRAPKRKPEPQHGEQGMLCNASYSVLRLR